MTIEKVNSLQVLDSRGNPTIETVIVSNGRKFSAIVPSGASTGQFEALELRDGGNNYMGKAVTKAVQNVNSIIAPKLKGLNPSNQTEIDSLMLELDGTEHKSKLGANAILSVSLVIARAGAAEKNIPLYQHLNELSGKRKMVLPVPQLNILNGGAHAGLENDIQETMIYPDKFNSFSDGLRAGVEIYHQLKKNLKKQFGPQGVLLGDEGGFVPKVNNFEDRLSLAMKAIEETGYEGKIKIAIDAASSEFFNEGSQTYSVGDTTYTANELTDFYKELVSKYPIYSIEDGMSETDWLGWIEIKKSLGDKIQLVGDDLLVTNTKIINEAIEKKACNSLLLKVNQIGSLTESLAATELSFKNNWTVVVSHRSGETEDNFIADLVTGIGSGQSKFGAPARSDRNSKYNRLLKIENEFEGKIDYGL